jgi:hypothetical protein
MSLKRIEGCGWRLIFVPGNMEQYFEHEECGDIRFFREGSNNFKKGQHIEGHFLDNDGNNLELEVKHDTIACPLKDLPQKYRDLWGRKKTSVAQILKTMHTFGGVYESMDRNTIVSYNTLSLCLTDSGAVDHPFPEVLLCDTENGQRESD